MKSASPMTRRKLFGLIPLPFLAATGREAPAASQAPPPAARFIRFSKNRFIDLTKVAAFQVWRSSERTDSRLYITVWVNGSRLVTTGDEERVAAVRDYILDYMRSQGIAAPHGCLETHLDEVRNT